MKEESEETQMGARWRWHVIMKTTEACNTGTQHNRDQEEGGEWPGNCEWLKAKSGQRKNGVEIEGLEWQEKG
ncbi:hypothetical protein Pmani_000117 [Petrolisthes manimaculis]|uniref:Uncharacterized protein n=1 Tax=Petrolisthes manimaculis TaxID=1843537 RepID=A0AAE1UTB3_9EUCA|nr:hypothetical protein Pmani_000117 [Petrolisthes manimaculis]